MKIGLIDLLELGEFDASKPTKVVRHKDKRISVEQLLQNDWLEQYQAYQKHPVFHGVEQVVSFYGLSGTRAGFYGVYKVLGHVPATQGSTVPPGQDWAKVVAFFIDWNAMRNSESSEIA